MPGLLSSPRLPILLPAIPLVLLLGAAGDGELLRLHVRSGTDLVDETRQTDGTAFRKTMFLHQLGCFHGTMVADKECAHVRNKDPFSIGIWNMLTGSFSLYLSLAWPYQVEN